MYIYPACTYWVCFESACQIVAQPVCIKGCLHSVNSSMCMHYYAHMPKMWRMFHLHTRLVWYLHVVSYAFLLLGSLLLITKLSLILLLIQVSLQHCSSLLVGYKLWFYMYMYVVAARFQIFDWFVNCNYMYAFCVCMAVPSECTCISVVYAVFFLYTMYMEHCH